MIVWGNKVFSLNSLQIGDLLTKLLDFYFLLFWLVILIIELFSLQFIVIEKVSNVLHRNCFFFESDSMVKCSAHSGF